MLKLGSRLVAEGLVVLALWALAGCGGGRTVDTADWVDGPMNELVTSMGQAVRDCDSLETWVDDAQGEAVPEDGELADAWEGAIDAADDYNSICEEGSADEKVTALGDINKALSRLQDRVAEL